MGRSGDEANYLDFFGKRESARGKASVSPSGGVVTRSEGESFAGSELAGSAFVRIKC